MADEETARTRARVNGIYAAYLAGDMAAVLDAMTDDVRWVSGEANSRAPWCGEHVGRAGVQAYFAALTGACRVIDYRIGQVIADGAWTAVTATVRARFHHSDAEIELGKVDVLRLHEGRIAEFREYYDTAALAAACPA